VVFRGLLNVLAVVHIYFFDLEYVEDTICDTEQGTTNYKWVSDA